MTDPDVRLETDRLLLFVPPPEAAPRAVRYYHDNTSHHGPWDPPRPTGFLTEGFWQRRLEMNRDEARSGTSLRLFMVLRDAPDGPFVGSCNLTGIVRGPFQCSRVGYSLDREHIGLGLMYEGLGGALDYAFQTLRLHRVEANYVPTNLRSGRLLRRLGFEIQGYARDYLFIDGAWRDHVLTALTNPDAPLPLPA